MRKGGRGDKGGFTGAMKTGIRRARKKRGKEVGKKARGAGYINIGINRKKVDTAELFGRRQRLTRGNPQIAFSSAHPMIAVRILSATTSTTHRKMDVRNSRL